MDVVAGGWTAIVRLPGFAEGRAIKHSRRPSSLKIILADVGLALPAYVTSREMLLCRARKRIRQMQ